MCTFPALRAGYPLMEGRPLEAREPRALDWSGEPAREPALSQAVGGDTVRPPMRSSNRATGYLGSLPSAGLLTEHRES